MTMPAYASKGTAGLGTLDSCIGTMDTVATLPATINADDVLVMVIRANCFAGGATIDTVTVDTANGTWTQLLHNGIGTTTYMGVFYLVAAGTEDGASQTVNIASSGVIGSSIVQVFRFTGSGAGLIDTSSGGTTSGSSTTPSFTGVTTSVANELAVGMLTAGTNTTVGNVTGESGGDWTEAAAEDTGSTKTVQCQTAGMASAGTITGGTCTLGFSTEWRTFSFALKEKVAAAKAMPVFSRPLRFAPRRARSF